MKKGSFGRLAIILGGLLLSSQMYGIKFIQILEMQTGAWITETMYYAKETTTFLSLLITLGVIIYGIFLTIQSDKEKNI